MKTIYYTCTYEMKLYFWSSISILKFYWFLLPTPCSSRWHSRTWSKKGGDYMPGEIGTVSTHDDYDTQSNWQRIRITTVLLLISYFQTTVEIQLRWGSGSLIFLLLSNAKNMHIKHRIRYLKFLLKILFKFVC